MPSAFQGESHYQSHLPLACDVLFRGGANTPCFTRKRRLGRCFSVYLAVEVKSLYRPQIFLGLSKHVFSHAFHRSRLCNIASGSVRNDQYLKKGSLEIDTHDTSFIPCHFTILRQLRAALHISHSPASSSASTFAPLMSTAPLVKERVYARVPSPTPFRPPSRSDRTHPGGLSSRIHTTSPSRRCHPCELSARAPIR